MADRETLVERLRARAIWTEEVVVGTGIVAPWCSDPLSDEAASELDRLKAKVEELEREPSFDPMKGGCPHCTWLDTNLGRVLDKKCALHQKIEDVQADAALDSSNLRSLNAHVRQIADALGCADDDDPLEIARARMEEIQEYDREVADLSARLARAVEDAVRAAEGVQTDADFSAIGRGTIIQRVVLAIRSALVLTEQENRHGNG